MGKALQQDKIEWAKVDLQQAKESLGGLVNHKKFFEDLLDDDLSPTRRREIWAQLKTLGRKEKNLKNRITECEAEIKLLSQDQLEQELVEEAIKAGASPGKAKTIAKLLITDCKKLGIPDIFSSEDKVLALKTKPDCKFLFEGSR